MFDITCIPIPLGVKTGGVQKNILRMVTSSNGNIFRVTGHLCGEFTGHQWIPRTKANDVELWSFFVYAWIKGWVNNREAGNLRHQRAYYDVTVMGFRKELKSKARWHHPLYYTSQHYNVEIVVSTLCLFCQTLCPLVYDAFNRSIPTRLLLARRDIMIDCWRI